MKTVKIGIVGAGNRALGLGRILARKENVSVTALCDPDRERLSNLSEDLCVPENGRFNDFKTMVGSSLFDSVVITSPDHTHHQITIEAAGRGKNILCEKPMALKLEHCAEMLKAAKDNNVLLMMGFCLRYNNLYKTAKEIIDSGEIGKIKLVSAADSVERGSAYFFHSWHRLNKNSGGLLLQKAVHSIDIINWMLDASPVSVFALGGLDVFGGKESNEKRCSFCAEKKSCPEFIDAAHYHSDYISGSPFVVEDKCVFAKEIDIMDNSALLIKYTSGVKVSFTECHFSPDYKREFSFVGDKGRLEILDFYSDNGDNTPRNEIRISKRHDPEVSVRNVRLKTGGHGGGDEEMMDEFIDLIAGKKLKTSSDGAAGLMSAAIAAAAEESIKNGGVSVLKPLP
jgi:predicted dehydrogenase